MSKTDNTCNTDTTNKENTTSPPITLPIPDRTTRDPLIDAFVEHNSITNLSAIRQPDDIFTKHIIDSLAIDLVISAGHIKPTIHRTQMLLDVGTGGGFPLLPIAQHYPHRDCHGLDARRKKITAVTQIATQAHLSNVTLHRSRAEDHDAQYHIVTARAVAHIDTLLPRLLPRCRRGGTIILYKQPSPDEHTAILTHCKTNNSLTLTDIIAYNLPTIPKRTATHTHDESNHDDTPPITPRSLYVIHKR